MIKDIKIVTIKRNLTPLNQLLLKEHLEVILGPFKTEFEDLVPEQKYSKQELCFPNI